MRKLTIQEQEVLKAAILVLHSATKEKIRTPQNLDVADLTIDENKKSAHSIHS